VALPGSKLWQASLVGYTQVSDWDLNNGGVVVFDDGTIWSYESESPANGDQPMWYFPSDWFTISELKPGSEVWERLMPDTWGHPAYDPPPGFPKWPYSWNDGDWLNPALTDFSGQLNTSRLGSQSSDYCHVQDGDDVWFYNRFGGGAYPYQLGPIKVNKNTRAWERFITDEFSDEVWADMRSNLVISDGYFWFLAARAGYWDGPTWIPAPDGMKLVRIPLSDPNVFENMHEWDDPIGWSTGQITSNLTLPDFIDNQYMPDQNGYSIAIDDGYLYFFTPTNSQIIDSRNTGVSYNGDSSMQNYNLRYSMLRRFRIGDYDLETIIWHTSPQGFVGYGGTEYGTYFDATVGITSQPDLTAAWSGSGAGSYPAIGMGMDCTGQHDMIIRDGWLYWLDWSGHNFGVYGEPTMICRFQLSKYSGTMIQHDVMNPAFEIVSNGTVPDEGNAGHWGNGGTFIWQRGGAQPIMPKMDQTLTFDDDGNILYKAMAFPPYYPEHDGYGMRCIWKLKPGVAITTNVTVTFKSRELKGYSQAREIPVTRGITEVELS
jgi:hypothetical protein